MYLVKEGEEMFISFEGIDKSGKTTQATLLAKYLKDKGHPVVFTLEPGGTYLGEKIKELILHTPKGKIKGIDELFLYLTDRYQHVKEVIEPSLKKGKLVISDRYSDATIAYQGYGRGLDIRWIENLNKKVTGGLLPDITFLLDIDPKVMSKRGKAEDRIEKEDFPFYTKVRQGYLQIAKSFPERVKLLNGEKDPQQISLEIRKILNKKLGE